VVSKSLLKTPVTLWTLGFLGHPNPLLTQQYTLDFSLGVKYPEQKLFVVSFSAKDEKGTQHWTSGKCPREGKLDFVSDILTSCNVT
jgi:hypothetical protein